MKNFKCTIKTDDVVNRIKSNVKESIKYYEASDDLWKTYVRIATYEIRVMTLEAVKMKSNFCEAWEELMYLTGYETLYRYKGIAEFINEKFNI